MTIAIFIALFVSLALVVDIGTDIAAHALGPIGREGERV